MAPRSGHLRVRLWDTQPWMPLTKAAHRVIVNTMSFGVVALRKTHAVKRNPRHSPIFKPKTTVITPTNTHGNMPCCCLSRCVHLYVYVCYMYDCLPIFDSNRMCPSRECGGSNTYNIPYSHICGAIKYKCKAGGRKWCVHSRRQLGKRDSRRGNDSVFRKNFVHAPSPPCGYWRAN